MDFIERRKVRLEDFRVWIEKFSSSRFVHVYGKVSFKPNSADLLNELYWLVRDQTESRMRDVGHRLDRHKMASMLEMTVMAALPIKTSENLGNDLPFCNAAFAMFCALDIVLSWGDTILDTDCPSFCETHLLWLRWCHQEHFPIFSNAMTWYAFECYCHEREAVRAANNRLKDFL